MPAKGVRNTDVTEGEWDGPGAVAAMPNEEATLWYCHAWREAGGDVDAKQTYKFPHHRTQGGPAVLNGVRNALARLSNSSIPEEDKAGVRRHLEAHLNKGREEEGMVENGEREVRNYQMIEVRVSEAGTEPRIEGIAAVYNQPTEIDGWFGSFIEVIDPGFFEGVLRNDVRALWNHNTDLVIGRTKNGTLKLNDQEAGLGVEIDPPDTQTGRDAVTSIRRGDVDQMSFAFSVKQGWDEWKENEEGNMVRTLKRGACKQLYDVSPVSFPAYPQTSVGVRSVLSNLAAGGSLNGDADQAIQIAAAEARAQRRVRAKNRKRHIEIESLKR